MTQHVRPSSFTPSAVSIPPTAGLLAQRGAAALPHPGGTLAAHLQRTAGRLCSWGADPALVAAGACHAAYGTQGFAPALLRLSERELLRTEIGDEAEAIVYAYCALDRTGNSARAGELRDRFNGEYWVASGRMRHQLAELTAANELDVVEHADCSAPQLTAIGELIAAAGAYLSQPAWTAWQASPCARAAAPAERASTGDGEIAYRDLGTHGERVVLWHGGAAPELTWSRQHVLSSEVQLRIPWRRGFAPSVAALRQDWEADARDLLRVMPGRCHVVGHSYGAVGALVAAAHAPERFRSLTLIEPPLWSIAAHDEQVQQLAALGRAFAAGAPEARAAFLALAAMPLDHVETKRTERLARDFRDPGQAVPDLAALRESRLPIAVVSGEHCRGLETLCDALGCSLNARRWRLPKAGHAAQRHPEFNPRLRALVAAASSFRV
jgi:pimeloyl-ACP methyl ester carboxylesterase